jgi:hypothetical protein
LTDVASCSVNPSSIAIGGQSSLSVSLTAPAPGGGLTVIIDTDFGQGSQDTLLNTPQSLGFAEGDSQSTFPLQTQSVDNAATTIIFSAQIGNGAPRAAQLNIS